MISKENIDLVFDLIQIDDTTLSWLKKPFLINECERLTKLSHLGVLSQLHPLARHTKWEHHLGCYMLAKRVIDTLGLTKSKLGIEPENFLRATIIHGIGHLPYSYPVEQGLLDYIAENDNDPLVEKLDQIAQIYKSRQTSFEQDSWRKVVATGDVNQFFKWITAIKLAEIRSKQTQIIEQNELLDLLTCFIAPDEPAFDLLWKIDRLDYALRDTYYFGRAKLNLNIPYFLQNIIAPRPDRNVKRFIMPSEWILVEQVLSYMQNVCYREPLAVVARDLLAKATRYSLEKQWQKSTDILDVTEREFDDAIRDSLQEVAGYQGVIPLVSALRKKHFVQVCEITGPISDTNGYRKLERQLVGVKSTNELTYPNKIGSVVSITPIDKGRQQTVQIMYDESKHHLDNLLDVMSRLRQRVPPVFLDMRDDLCRLVFGREGYCDFGRYDGITGTTINGLLPKEGRPLDLVKEAIEEEYAVFVVSSARNRWKAKRKDVIPSVVNRFLREPWMFKNDFVAKVIENLSRRRTERELCLELIGYLNLAVIEQMEEVEDWVFPSLKLFNDDGSNWREVDCLRIRQAKSSRILFQMHEYTTNANIDKRHETIGKLRTLRQVIRNRFGKRSRVEAYFNDSPLAATG